MRTPIRRWLLVTAIALGVCTPALAQDVPATQGEAQEFNFDEDEVSTDFLKPTTLLVTGLLRGRKSVLISVRLDFVDEIVKSAEDI